jgi:nitroreductase
VPTIEGRLDGLPLDQLAGRFGSVFPGVWSFMLALRERGMGSVWTTHHLKRERAVAELLSIPYDEVTQVGLFPVAYTLGTDFKAADRSSSRVRWNTW